MEKDRNFLKINSANLIARSAYQMGKTPLLPIFAASLGANDTFLGFIVSVSTLTGMIFKPFIGILSDRWGRRAWLILGTGFFSFMPFVYWFVHTPPQLFLVRIVHGLATAIYGPVTLAYVAEQWPVDRAAKLGWMDSARSLGYVLGPALAGWLLELVTPVVVFTIIGIMSTLVFIPILTLPESVLDTTTVRRNIRLRHQIRQAFSIGGRSPSVWLGGGLEAMTYVATYAIKAFLPVYALKLGISVAVIGVFFAVQEGANMVVKPFGGIVGDRLGYFFGIISGMLALGFSLIFIPYAPNNWFLLLAAVVLGAAQGLIFPSTTALVSAQVESKHLGAGMGLLGTLQNAGKVVGPLIGGVLINQLDYEYSFITLGIGLVIGAGLIAVFKPRGGQDQKRAGFFFT